MRLRQIPNWKLPACGSDLLPWHVAVRSNLWVLKLSVYVAAVACHNSAGIGSRPA